MTHNNNFFANGIEDLPPSGIDAVSRSRITGYTPTEPDVIDTGTNKLESPTVKDITAQREDNPFLRLAVIGGVMGVICLFLWGVFAFLSPDTPTVVEEEVEVEETVEAEPDYQAQLAFRDQFHSLEKKPEPQSEAATNELPPATKTESLPQNKSTVQSAPPRPIPQPVAPRPVPRSNYRSVPRPIVKPVPTVIEPKVPPQEQWQALANFGSGVSSRSVPQPRTQAQRPSDRRSAISQTNLTPAPALLVNNSVSQGELGILNRRRTNTRVIPSAPAITLTEPIGSKPLRGAGANAPLPAKLIAIDRGITKGKIELPLVWDSSLAPEQQQSNQITVILEEPIYNTEGKVIFDRSSVAIVEVQSINDTNGLVTAYVSQIDNTIFEPGELILRNSKKSALVAKASKRSNFGNRLLVGGVDTLSSFGQQILIPETNSTVSNGSAIVTSQSRNSVGRDLAGSALDGFGSSLSNELEQRNTRNQIGDGGTIFTLSQNTTVYLTNIKPLKINP